ncbi:MAG: UDP-N-acetylmuramate--L-alanine ligase [Clostridia bacterium]|nr:UDP-N-acetylmuramate--L-alanine ligase [Clostridia bacterium]
MKKRLFCDIKEVYLIGIGGAFMSAIAKYCVFHGKKVSGSDREKSENTESLKKIGVKIYVGHSENNFKSADAVVYSSAISDDNPELLKAKKSGTDIYKRSEFLGVILNDFKNVIAVAGCHGKTTTTSMLAHVLAESGKAPTAFIGGEDSVFGNFLAGDKAVAVTEACEYKKNFLDIYPTVSVIMNTDFDHVDSYKDENDLKQTYKKFSENSFKIINADDKNCAYLSNGKSLTFGFTDKAFYRAENLKKGVNGYSFTLTVGGVKKFRVRLKVPGRYNVYNALAAYAASQTLGVSPGIAKKSLENFTSVKRRTEFLGEYGNKKLYADYAHHPNEISSVIPVFSEKSLFVFQPHTYSRTKTLKDEFSDALKNVDCVIYKTYPARETYDSQGDAYSLYLSLKSKSSKNVFYAKNIKNLKRIIDDFDGTTVIFLGAGNLYFFAKKFFIDKKF